MNEKTLADLVQLNTKHYTGIKIKYNGNVLYSCSQRTAEDNFIIARNALCLLVGLKPEVLFSVHEDDKSIFENDGGTVEFYRSSG